MGKEGNLNDFLLILQMKQGNEKAFDKFVRKYYAEILSYCRYHCLDQAEAEDLTQETFLRFMENIASYQHIGKAKNYLYVIAGNLCKNYAKKWKAESVEQEILERELVSDGGIHRKEKRMDVEQALGRLAPELREVILLIYFGDCKLKEVADILQIGLPLVKYRHKRAKEELKKGNDVVIDATYIKKKHRIHFLKELNKIPCIPVCIVMATEYSLCILNNYSRDRKVPEEVIKRMLLNWQPPHYGEGFDKISYVFSYYNDFKLVHNKQKEKYNFDTFYKVANVFDQENSHHKLTLGEHCAKAGEKIQELSPDNFWLLVGALLHDNGKIFTKTRNNIKGIDDGDCHYYQHHCVGAYNAMFYLHSFEDIKSNDIAYVTNLIYYHMRPYCEWKQSEKALNRDKQLLGTKLYDDIMLLHIADLFAH